MAIYQINLSNHFRVAKQILFFFIVYVFIGIFIIVHVGFNDKIFVLKGLTAIIILVNFPAIYLHYFYFLENKNMKLNEYESHIEIYDDDNEIIILNEENVIAIDIFMSVNKFKYDITSGLPTEEYNYLKFKTIDKEIIITSLIYPNIKKLSSNFSSIKPKLHKTIFATI